MIGLKTVKEAYLTPGALRECSPLLAFLGQLDQQFRAAKTGYIDQPEAGIPMLPALANIDLSDLRAVWHPWEF